MPAAPTATPAEIKDANTRYHDAASSSYDAKWGIDFGQIGRRQVGAKLVKALGGPPERAFGDALEIGAGTGYFSLNLVQLGIVERVVASDISQGMLDSLAATARRLGIELETVRADAERLPFAEASFDLVFGHAVLHHLPDLDRALAEFRRVLRPGGAIVFCGEPSRYGDRIAALPKRSGAILSPAWRRTVGARRRTAGPAESEPGCELESEVDVHAFSPAEIRRLLDRAGFEAVHVRGEELLANVYGWMLRSLESSAEPDAIPRRWQSFAYRSYIALQRFDAAVLEPRLPPQMFYNLVLSARRPPHG